MSRATCSLRETYEQTSTGICDGVSADLVPSLTRGDYHAAGFACQPNPPSPDEVVKLGKVFGLGKSDVRRCADQVKEAISQWRDIAMEVGVPEADMERIRDRITT